MSLFKIEFSKATYTIDLAVYLVAPIVGFVFIMYFVKSGNRLASLSTIALGMLAWTLLEYALHRFVLHSIQPFKGWHDRHHDEPRASVGTPTALSLLLIIAGIFLPAIALAGVPLGGGFALGVLIGYGLYTWMHHGEHHWRKDYRWFRRLKRCHAIHHHKCSDCNYGVTTLLWDRLFGTYRA